MEFQQRLYELRKQSGLSQEGLASLLGVTRQAVQKWESGSSRPDMDNLAALARYFNVSLDYLVTGEERSAPPPATTIINNYYSRWHYEYKSPQTFFGLPLIHIRLGERGLCTARGIIAIGNCAVGVLAIGGFSFGLVSVGGLSLGLLFSLGGWAVGALAVGGLALGLLAFGGWRPVSSPWAVVPSGYTRPGARLPPQKSPLEARPPPLWPSGRRRRDPSPLAWALTRRRCPRPSGRRPPVYLGFSRSS